MRSIDLKLRSTRLGWWLALGTALALATTSCSLGDVIQATEPAPAVTLSQATDAPPHSDLADVIETLLPSVVNVRVRGQQTDPFGQTRQVEGQGSGVVIDEGGIILTNNHVVQGSVTVDVVFNDDHGTLQGEVIGLAPERDLAVVRVDADDLAPVQIGRSSDLRLGDDVIAIGFPLGLGGPTVTRGILSGTERTIQVSSDQAGGAQTLEGLLQTDAAINPGNSGGALVDAAGRLVGINTAAAQAGSAENIGFAIAIDSALPLIAEILDQPTEPRGYLGVSVGSVDSPGVAAQLGLEPDVRGAVILDVFNGGPAQKAGLEIGEVIIDVAGHEVSSSEDLTESLIGLAAGDRVTVKVIGPNGSRTVDVVVVQRPSILEAG